MKVFQVVLPVTAVPAALSVNRNKLVLLYRERSNFPSGRNAKPCPLDPGIVYTILAVQLGPDEVSTRNKYQKSNK